MKPLVSLDKEQLLNWIEDVPAKTNQGQVLDYIPLLNSTNPDYFGLYILSLNGEVFSSGDTQHIFPLMSLIKPFVLLYLLCDLGADAVFSKVGKQPSTYPFNSLSQLKKDQGFPRNPMINSGAMTLASLLPEKDAYSRCENLRLWLNRLAKCQLSLSQSTLNSVQSKPNVKNQILIKELAARGYIEDPVTTLDTYNRLCCLAGNVIDLAKLGMLLLTNEHNYKIVQELMLTCGLYEASREFAAKVGFPTKSGVSGGVVSIVPHQGAIACYSPPLNQQGNSVAGLFLIEQIAQSLAD